MKEIFKPIFEWITGNFNLFDNQIYNLITMSIIGFVAFAIAWNFVGKLYEEGLIEGSSIGSIIHWIVRLISFMMLFTIVSVIIWIVKAIISIPMWVWTVLLISIVVISILYLLITKMKKITGIGKLLLINIANYLKSHPKQRLLFYKITYFSDKAFLANLVILSLFPTIIILALYAKLPNNVATIISIVVSAFLGAYLLNINERKRILTLKNTEQFENLVVILQKIYVSHIEDGEYNTQPLEIFIEENKVQLNLFFPKIVISQIDNILNEKDKVCNTEILSYLFEKCINDIRKQFGNDGIKNFLFKKNDIMGGKNK